MFRFETTIKNKSKKGELRKEFEEIYVEFAKFITKEYKESVVYTSGMKYIKLFDKQSVETLDEMIDRFKRIKEIGAKATKEKMILSYGEEEGLEKWESYVKFQSDKNKFEYKQKVYGFTNEDFIEYNKSRSVTLENCKRRHGEEEGRRIFREYCERQSYAGCHVDYFKEKYGEEEGRRIFRECNEKKKNTVETFKDRYGEEEGERAFQEYIEKLSKTMFRSKVSQELFFELEGRFSEDLACYKTYFGEKNCEFHKLAENNKSYFYDYVIPDLNFCIEFNGNIYHANPLFYGPEEIPQFRGNKEKTARQIWVSDEKKNDFLRSKGFEVHVIWEYDYVNEKETVLNYLLERINELHRNRKLLGRRLGSARDRCL